MVKGFSNFRSVLLIDKKKQPVLYKKFLKQWQLYLLVSVPVVYILIFHYIPMIGAMLAFKDFRISLGILKSPWAGMKYFNQFINSPIFWNIMVNTLRISLYSLIAGFPIPIIMALALNEIKNGPFKKAVQTITYAPHFISTVVMVGIVFQLLSYRYGLLNTVIRYFGGQGIDFMGESGLFRSIYVWSGVWQNAGYSAIIYIAALSGIDIALYEAAIIDGASKFKRMLYIDLPGIAPTIITMLILSAGGILSVGFEKIFLMQNPLNYNVSEVISTYVYKIGITQAQYSFSTAIGLFNSLINFIMLVLVNQIAKRVGDTSLW